MRQEEPFHDLTAPMRVVYDPDGVVVKPRLKTCFWYRHYIGYTCLFSVISSWFLVPGCSFPGEIREKGRLFQPSATIAVQYQIPPFNNSIGHKHARGEIGKIREDFNVIKNLGFQTVLINPASEDIQPQIKQLAEQTDLNIDFEFDGTIDQPATNERMNEFNPVHQSKEADSADILGSSTPPSGHDLRRLANRSANPAPHPIQLLAMINLQKIDSDPHYSASAQLLAQYHRALIAGKTKGIVVGPFRKDMESSTSLLQLDQPLNPSDRTAIANLIGRVNIWGTALYGMYARPLQPIQFRKDVDVTVFFRGRRQYLFIFNPLTNRYARGRIVIEKSNFIHPLQRAVELPASKEVLGDVVLARDGVFTFSIELRPGDAVLYELF